MHWQHLLQAHATHPFPSPVSPGNAPTAVPPTQRHPSPSDVGVNGPLLLPTRGRCRPVGRGALHPQRCRGRKPLLQTAAASVRLPFLASLLHPPPHHVSWNHTLSQPCLRLGLKDARDSALLCFSPCDKAGEGVTTFTCIWRGKAFLPLVEEDS